MQCIFMLMIYIFIYLKSQIISDCEKTVVNTINYLLQLTMVGSCQQLLFSVYMETIVRLYR